MKHYPGCTNDKCQAKRNVIVRMQKSLKLLLHLNGIQTRTAKSNKPNHTTVYFKPILQPLSVDRTTSAHKSQQFHLGYFNALTIAQLKLYFNLFNFYFYFYLFDKKKKNYQFETRPNSAAQVKQMNTNGNIKFVWNTCVCFMEKVGIISFSDSLATLL